MKPRRTTPLMRLAMVVLGKMFPWREALVIVKPETFIKWHRTAFRMFWCRKSRKRGRPPLPKNIRELVAQIARENRIWGEEQISNELLLKLGIRISPRTVRKYLNLLNPRPRRGDQRWMTFVRNHAKAIVACDFMVSIQANFRILYIFVAMDISSRRVLHVNVTQHPTAEWTTQQFREIFAFDHPYRFVIHDRDSIFSPDLDRALRDFNIRPLLTPARAPQANAYCERLIGTIRRECLDYVIPFGEKHLKRILREFIAHYNRGRPHSSLGPGIPEPPEAKVPAGLHRHKLPIGYRVTSTPILGGLHHEYGLEKEAA